MSSETTDAERVAVAAWAAAREVTIVWPEEYADGQDDFHANPCIDFGRVVHRKPRFVVRPRNVDQLVACMAMLREREIPYHVRGAGHSSGGQSLSDGGAVIHTHELTGILDDRPDAEQITVAGGTWWLSVIEHLQPQGRRPLVLTGNPRLTVAGTLSTGGFGDTTHLDGMVIRSIDSLTLIAPDGTRHSLRRGDELFHYVLAGRGQLGVIADATIRTAKLPMRAAIHHVRWRSLPDFVRDSAVIAKHRLYAFVRARLHWEQEVCVDAAIGNFVDSLPAAERAATAAIRPIHVTELELRDLFADLQRAPQGTEWQLPTPAMEVTLPLPEGLDVWPRLRDQIISSGLVPFLGRGTSVMVVPAEPDFPLAPVSARTSLLIALRPEAPADRARELLPALRSVGEIALAAGGRVHLMSIDLATPRFAERQFGAVIAARFRAIKMRLDPLGLCNPGLL